MHSGKIVDAVIKAIIDKMNGLHHQVDLISSSCKEASPKQQ
jgi:hypothetical protein